MLALIAQLQISMLRYDMEPDLIEKMVDGRRTIVEQAVREDDYREPDPLDSNAHSEERVGCGAHIQQRNRPDKAHFEDFGALSRAISEVSESPNPYKTLTVQ